MTTEATPNKRWNSHKAAIKHNNGCPLLTNAFKKYGIKSFKFEIIIICFDEDSYKYEKEYIKNIIHYIQMAIITQKEVNLEEILKIKHTIKRQEKY